MHFEIIDKERYKLLKDITDTVSTPNYYMIGMGLSYFEDAEQEILPKTFVEYNWDKIKEFFIKFQSEFYKILENIEA